MPDWWWAAHKMPYHTQRDVHSHLDAGSSTPCYALVPLLSQSQPTFHHFGCVDRAIGPHFHEPNNLQDTRASELTTGNATQTNENRVD